MGMSPTVTEKHFNLVLSGFTSERLRMARNYFLITGLNQRRVLIFVCRKKTNFNLLSLPIHFCSLYLCYLRGYMLVMFSPSLILWKLFSQCFCLEGHFVLLWWGCILKITFSSPVAICSVMLPEV